MTKCSLTKLFLKSMASPKRCTPYSYKKKGEYKKREKSGELQMKQAGIDVENIKNRIELMTAEQVANCKEEAAQNALKFFNKLILELSGRVEKMSDPILVDTLMRMWDQIGGAKK